MQRDRVAPASTAVPAASQPWRHCRRGPLATEAPAAAEQEPSVPGAGLVLSPGKGLRVLSGDRGDLSRAPRRLQHLAPPAGNVSPHDSEPDSGGRACAPARTGSPFVTLGAVATSTSPPETQSPAPAATTANIPGQAAAVLMCSCASPGQPRLKGWDALPAAARGTPAGQDGPSARASHLQEHRHPELQIPGSSKMGAEPRTRTGQLLDHRAGGSRAACPPWVLWQTCKPWGGRGRQAAPAFSSSTGRVEARGTLSCRLTTPLLPQRAGAGPPGAGGAERTHGNYRAQTGLGGQSRTGSRPHPQPASMRRIPPLHSPTIV